MKCISILQPWAHLVMLSSILWINRDGPTSYLGPVLIHAGKKKLFPVDDANGMKLFCKKVEMEIPDNIQFGAIIGVATLAGCVRVEDISDPWASGPWCWRLDDPRPIEPVRYRGQLGLFNVPDSVVAGFKYLEVVR